MVIEVRSNRMPGGGLVITFSDVTPSFEAAEALERANATLEKRVRDRTEELTRLNSELALAKSTAEDASISKTRFLAAASHDILQPLNAARLYVTSLVERQTGGEDSRLVENIDDSLEAIEEILGALLDISRLDAGAMTTSITNFKIGDLMRSLEIEFAPIARAKGLKLTFVPCSLPVRIRSPAAAAAVAEPDFQRDQIHPARAGAGRLPPPRPIACRSASTIPASAFPFSSAARSSRNFTGSNRARGSRAASGSGCRSSSGSPACSATALRSIAIASGGSFFSVTVPTAKAINHTAAVTSATPLSRTPMSGALIACIENDAAILDGMKTLLTGWDAEVIAVTDPEAAIEAIEAAGKPVTGLLVDYHLDRGNGIAAIRDISTKVRRDDPGHPHHRRSQPACPRRGAGGKYRGAEQAGEAGILARAAGPVAHPADGGGGIILKRDEICMHRHRASIL